MPFILIIEMACPMEQAEYNPFLAIFVLPAIEQ